MLEAFFASGRFVDAVIGLTVLEGLGLWLWRRLTGRGPGSLMWLPNLAAGLCLMLALRAALSGAPWPWIALALAAAGASHALDWWVRAGGVRPS